MPALSFEDHRRDPAAWAKALGVSTEAIALYLSCDIIDLHVDSFIWTRAFGYDITRRHGRGLFGGRFYSQVDLPRLREAHIGGALWSITTNPLRSSQGRLHAFEKNMERLRAVLTSCPEDVALARNAGDYESAKKAGKHAAFFCIQGGNAVDADLGAIDHLFSDLIIAVTLVHLSTSRIGRTSSPFRELRADGPSFSDLGREYVRALNARRIFVDLAHIDRRGFFEAVEVHDRSQPLLVSHTGVAGVHTHWRNLDDAQIRAVAETGGTIGIIYQSSFLGDPVFSGKASTIVDHLEHVIAVAGEDFASLGSDWDGSIVPPRDLPTCLELPRLVQIMLERRWQPERVQKVLGGNFLRALRLLRG
jgi:membrane dipeptidase